VADRPRLVVTAALLEREGRWLMARRGEGGPCAGLWEFPGGKCDPGEGLSECLVRELAEELGLVAEAGEQVASLEHDYAGDYVVELHLLRAHSAGEPRAKACAEWRWVAPEDALRLDLAPADRRLIEAMAAKGLP
jgi:mutator protein MutT